MSVSLKNNQLSIKDIVIENELVTEYLSSLPASERESAVIRALGIGIMAEMKGEISHFLRETEGELGKHLSSLKALYDLRELRFRETSGKGALAEGQVLEVVREFASSAGFADDEVIDASTTSGAIRNNKTGDVLIRDDSELARLKQPFPSERASQRRYAHFLMAGPWVNPAPATKKQQIQ